MKTSKNLFIAMAAIELLAFPCRMDAQVPSYVPTDGLVGWWPFNGNADDDSGNEYHGEVNGAVLTTDRNDQPESAYYFDGVDDYVGIPDLGQMDSFTLSAWVYADDLPGANENRSILGNYTWKDGDFHWHLEDTLIRFAVWIEAPYLVLKNDFIGPQSWHHVALVYTRNENAILYVDGQQVGQKTYTKTINFTGTRIGSEFEDRYWKGKIDDVGIWGRALTHEEIEQLYTGEIENPCLPDYVPKDGLVGYWPFCGNADDESGNGNDGTVNGATLAEDRFGNINTAYSFDGSDWIEVVHNSIFDFESPNSISVSLWFSTSLNNGAVFVQKQSGVGSTQNGFNCGILNINGLLSGISKKEPGNQSLIVGNYNGYNNLLWHHFVYTFNNGNAKLYYDGQQLNSQTDSDAIVANSSTNLIFGVGLPQNSFFFNGKIDDIGIWNRALAPEEITDLYQGGCPNVRAAVSPTFAIGETGANALLVADLPDTLAAMYQWQTNPADMGWQDLLENATYSGSASDALIVNNLALANHLQPFRVVTSVAHCADTSEVAYIVLTDTCVVTAFDTITTYISVTDTLIIDITTTSVPLPGNRNTLRIYPNPASDHITIDYGDYPLMAGYRLRIVNALGQTVYETLVTQLQDYLSISGWGGTGIYFVTIIDPGGDTVDVRKIILK